MAWLFLVTCDLNTAFGHRPIYTRGEAATFIPNSSFAQSFHLQSKSGTPHGLTLNPSLSQLRIPQLLVEIPCPAKATLRKIGKMNLVMRRKCDMEAGE